ncbi:MAG: PEGA domain-containing protein [Actinobacteria bacterium]|nr:PEGA domain-containing protein [Actinomycetota bacterium]MBM3713334.1 PEGA domain-containing protein [Actinomycetota bacterium]
MEKTNNHCLKKYFMFIAFATIIFVFFISGCAPLQEISVTSEPYGAKVIVHNRVLAETPGTIVLKRNEDSVTVRFEKEGYEAKEVVLTRVFNYMPIYRTLGASISTAVLVAILPKDYKGYALLSGIGYVAGQILSIPFGFINGASYLLNPGELNIVLTKHKNTE